MASTTSFKFFRKNSEGNIISSGGGTGGAGGGFSLPSNLAYTNIQNTFSVEQNFNEEVRFLNSTGNTVYAKGEYPSSDPQLAFYHRTTGGGETQIIRFTETGVIVYGNLTVNGTEFIANTQTVLIEDNLLVINNGEVGSGVTAGVAGIQVDRGSLTDYQFLFEESSDTFRIGEIGSLQAVATREDSPTDGNIMTWDAATSSLVGIAQSGIDLDYVTTNGNTTTNSITVNGLTASFNPIDAQGDFRARSNIRFDSYAPTSGYNLLQVGTDGTLFTLPKSDIALQTDLANVAYKNINNFFQTSQDVDLDTNGSTGITIRNEDTGINANTTLALRSNGNNFNIYNYGDGTANANRTQFISTAGGSRFDFNADSHYFGDNDGTSFWLNITASGIDLTTGVFSGNGSGLTNINAATLGGEAITKFMLYANPSDINWTNGKVASYQNGEFVPVAIPSAAFTSFNVAATVGGSTTITDGETVTFVDGLNTTATRVGNTIQIDTALASNVAYTDVNNNFSVGQTIGGNTTINGGLTITSTSPSIVFNETDVTPNWRNRVSSGSMRFQYASDGSTYADALVIGATTATLDRDTTINGNLAVDTDTLFVDAVNKRVGVGTISPRTDINASSASGSIITLENSSTALNSGDSLGKLNFYSNDLSSSASGIRASIDAEVEGSFAETSLTFSTAGYLEASASERMRIDSNGNVGIGTSNPDTKLEVSTSSGASTVARITNTANTASYIQFEATGTGIRPRVGAIGSDLILDTANTERMRIDSNGNVGIGTSNPNAKLSFGTSNLDTNGYDVSTLRLYDDGSTVIYGIGVSATQLNYRAGLSNDQHVWYAGTTERMRIDSSGNVGIGKSPASGVKLDVNGKVSATSFSGDGSLLTNIAQQDISFALGQLTITNGSTIDFDARYTPSSNITLDFATDNNAVTTNAVTVGSVKTSAPSTSTARDWKLGDVHTVIDKDFDGKVLRVDVNGTIYELMVAEIVPI